MSVADSLLFVSLSMILLGLAATISWDAFFLDARDRYILAVLPVPERLLSAAKLAALCLFLAVFVVSANLIPSLLVPGLMLVPLPGDSGLPHVAPLMLAHASSVCLAGAWSMLAVVSLRGLLALVLPARVFQRVSPLVQGMLILGFLGWTISLSPFLDAAANIVARGGAARNISPPMWFLGLYQAIAGNPDSGYPPLARTALEATAVTALLVLIVFFAPRQRRSEHVAGASALGGLAARLAAVRTAAGRMAVRDPLGRASYSFTLTTMGRSAKHRLYLAGALGAGLAWAATGLVLEFVRSGRAAFGTATPSTTALQVQLVLVLFLIVAIRFGVLVPAMLPANWLFRITEQRPVAPYFKGARRAALSVGLLPVAAFVPVSAALWGWHAAGVPRAHRLPLRRLHRRAVLQRPDESALHRGVRLPLPEAEVARRVLPVRRHRPHRRPLLARVAGVPGPRGRRHAAPVARRAERHPGGPPLAQERALPGLVFDDTNGEAVQTLGLGQ